MINISKNASNTNLSIDLPLRWIYIKTNRDTLALNNLKFEPTLNLFRKITSNLNHSISIYKNNEYGKIKDKVYFPIFTSLSVVNQNGNFPILNNMSFNNAFEYKFVKENIFINQHFSYNRTKYNNLTNRLIGSDGIWENVILRNSNISNNYATSLGFSKFFGKEKLSLRASYFYQFSTTNVSLNSSIFTLKNWVNGFKLKIDFDKLNWLLINHQTNFSAFKSSINNKGFINENIVGIGIVLYSDHFLKFDHEMTYIKNQNQAFTNQFLDISYQYTFEKKKVDLFVKAVNLLNLKDYKETIFSEYGLFTNTYNLRPRQYTLGVKFNMYK